MKAWTGREKAGDVPFTPLAKPLAECTVALVSTAGSRAVGVPRLAGIA